MIDRACISINNRCNLKCSYCHFHDKLGSICPSDMDVFVILDNIREYINKTDISVFKIGFVGNGEPFLDYDVLQSYIIRIADLLASGRVQAYTITNGTCIDERMLSFMWDHKVNVGFSLDGPREIHNRYRCNTFDDVMHSIELYRSLCGQYPSLNCTVGREAIDDPAVMISFFTRFNSRITFSRMIGKLGITLNEYRRFISEVQDELNVRKGGYDCTMYGGMCAAGINNVFFSNCRIYMCGNCIDYKSLPYNTPIEQIDFFVDEFDRHYCYRETFRI